MNTSLYWLFGLLKSEQSELRALRLIIDGSLSSDIKANPEATDDGRGIMECLAYACRSEVFKSLKDQKSRAYSWYHNGDPNDSQNWEYAPNADVVFLELVRFGVSPWKSWKVPVSKFNPAGELDGFDLACALGSQPLAKACLEHPDCPPLETLYGRSGWRMGQPFSEGSPWKKVLTPKDGLVTVASAQGSWGLAQLLLEKGWPINPSIGSHPLVVAQTKKMVEVMEPFLESERVPEGVVDKWVAMAKNHQEGANTLNERTTWLMARGHSKEAQESLTKRAFELWKASGEEAKLGGVLSALGLPAPPSGGLTEEQRREHSRQKGLMWAKMPDMVLSSGGFAQLGKLPMWWCLSNLVLGFSPDKTKTQTSVFWLGSIALENPGLTCSLPEIDVSVRGTTVLLAQRCLSSSPSVILEGMMHDLGWFNPAIRSQIMAEAAEAVAVWGKWGTTTQNVKAREAFDWLAHRWAKEFPLPTWDDPCWSKILPRFQAQGIIKEFIPGLRAEIEKAPLEWAIKWLLPLVVREPQEEARELIGYVCDRMAAEKWGAAVITEALSVVNSPSSLPIVLGEDQWGVIASGVRSNALDLAWEPAPARSRVKL